MSLLEPTPAPEDPQRLALEARRSADRLRSMSLTRLLATLADGRSRADAAFAVAQQLADRAARLSGRPARPLPDLAPSAAGDALAVCAADLVEDLLAHPGAEADACCRASVQDLLDLRRGL